MAVEVDPSGRTFLYIMYVESIKLSSEMPEMAGTEVVCRWYIDQENDCSRPFTLSNEGPAAARYCSFMVLSFDDPSQRSRSVTMTLSQPDGSEHLCVAFLDLAQFSCEDVFKIDTVELKNQAGVVALAELHTAAQTRWQQGQPVEPRSEGFFANPSIDAQAERLYLHIMQEPPPQSESSAAEAAAAAAEAEQQQALAAKQAAEASEAEWKRQATQAAEAAEAAEAERQRLAADTAAEQQRQATLEAEQRRAAEEKRQQEEAAKKREEEQFLRQKMEQKEEEEKRERARKDEEMRAVKEAQLKEELAQQERQKKQLEDFDREKSRREIEARDAECEAERRRREEEDRIVERHRQQRDDENRARADDLSRSCQGRAEERERRREEDARDSGALNESERLRRLREREWEEAEFERRRKEDQERRDMQRLRERRQWEEDRERLRQDARREQERERADRERRAEERRRQVEALAKARLGTDSGYEVMPRRNTGQEGRGASRGASRGANQSRMAEPPGSRPSRSSEREVVPTEAHWKGHSSHESGHVEHNSRASNKSRATTEDRGDSRSLASETDEVMAANYSSARASDREGRGPRSQKGGSRTSAPAGSDVNECSTINTGRSHHSSTVAEDYRQRMAVMREVESDSEQSLKFEEEAAESMLEHQHRVDEMDYFPAENEFVAPGHGRQRWPHPVSAKDSRRDRAKTNSASEVASNMLELRRPTRQAAGVSAQSVSHGPGPASTSLRLEQLRSMPGGHARHSPGRYPINSGGEELDDAASSVLNIDTSMMEDALQSTPHALGDSRGNSIKGRAAGRAGRAAGRGSSMGSAAPREAEGVDAALGAWGGRHELRKSCTQRQGRRSVPSSRAPLQSQHASQPSSATGMPGMAAPTSGAALGANGIVAAALADAAVGGVNGLTTLPVAAVEECVLRLLVLQRELSGSEEPGRSALLDAAAGLAPRMLQVLEAARSVCVTNRAKLRTFCEERHLNFDTLGNGGSAYMTPQLSALEKLHGQYASLLPVAPASTLMAAGNPNANLNFDVAGHTTMGYPTQSAVHHSHGLHGASGSCRSHVGMAPAFPADALATAALRPMSPNAGHDALTLGPPQQRRTTSSPRQQQQQLSSATGQQQLSAATLHPPGHVMDEACGARLGNALARHTPPSPLMDPGGVGPQLPMLRPGGSTPPPAKFRQQQQQPCVTLSTGQRHPANTQCGAPAWQSTDGADGNSICYVSVKSIPAGESNTHGERDDWGLASSARSRSSSRQPPPAAQLSRGSSPMPGGSRRASSAAGSHGITLMNDNNSRSNGPSSTTTPRAQQAGATLLATAVEDLMDTDFQQVPSRVAFATKSTELKEDLAARRRSSSRPETGSRRTSAGAGSPSPDQRVSRGHKAGSAAQACDAMPVPAEDKYLKILRSLQAKGAAGVPGEGNQPGKSSLAAQLLEGARRNRMLLTPKKSIATKATTGLVNDSDSESDSSSSGSGRR